MASSENPAPTRSNKVVWLVLAVCLLPVVASTVLYLVWKPDRHVNHGELIQPVPLAQLAFDTVDGPAFSFHEIDGRWSFVSIDSGDCDEHCERKLYLMRQIRLTQGKDSDRIERVWLVSGQAPPTAATVEKYEGTRVVRISEESQVTVFPAERDRRDYVYIVDHLGNVMMRFPADVDPSLMKKDVSKLLRLSSGWRRLDR